MNHTGFFSFFSVISHCTLIDLSIIKIWLSLSMIHLFSCSVTVYVYSCMRMVNLNPRGKHCYQLEYYTYVQFLLPQFYILGLFHCIFSYICNTVRLFVSSGFLWLQALHIWSKFHLLMVYNSFCTFFGLDFLLFCGRYCMYIHEKCWSIAYFKHLYLVVVRDNVGLMKWVRKHSCCFCFMEKIVGNWYNFLEVW